MLIKVTVPAQKFREIVNIPETIVAIFEVIGYYSDDDFENWILPSDSSLPHISDTFISIVLKKNRSSDFRLIPTWQQKDGKHRGAILEVSSVTVVENYPQPSTNNEPPFPDDSSQVCF